MVLRSVIRDEKGPILCAAALLTCWSVGEALVPAVIGATVDEAIGRSDLSSLILWLVALAACFSLLSFGFMWGSRVGVYAMNRQKHLLRGRVTATALQPDRPGTGRRLPGEITALSAADSDNASNVIMQIAMGGSALLGLAVSVGYLMWADLWVGCAVILVSPLSLLALRWLRPRLSSTTHGQQQGIAAAGASAADILRGVEVLRGIGGEPAAAGWYTGRSRAAATAGIASAGASGRVGAAHILITGLVLVSAAILSAFRVMDGSMTVGAMVGVLGVTSFLATPLSTIVGVVETYTASAASAARIAQFVDGRSALGVRRPATDLARADATLTILPENCDPLDCAAGRLTVIVCADPDIRRRVQGAVGRGRLLLDGVQADSMDPELLPTVLRVSPHEAHLFKGTVRRNITGSDGGFVPQAVLRASGVDELVDLFDEGLDHEVDGGGRNLSGGQCQRIALARALAGGPLTRVLTDPTTAVDSVTEARIATGLRALRTVGDQGTTVIISTSPNLLAAADEVIFVRDETTATVGTHHDLSSDSSYSEVVSR
ncbi:MAG: ABC transporter transmembrane domain-containing protein [Corynebacterium sp.]|jgi:putative ABC transport system ATP-binding protein|uniref:ABC transporter transmembrane domain-containing protein n=1 Tax=Corynebacterium sp. TaxID=1720 RepID=UPI003F0A3DC3